MDHENTYPYDNEGYSALDIPTTAALRYVMDIAALTNRGAAEDLDGDEVSPDAARTQLVIDAGCDLPSTWLAKHNVAVVPIHIKMGDERLRDDGNEADRMAFVGRLSGRIPPLRISPARPVQIRDYLQTWMTPQIDNVVQLTFAATGSSVYLSSLAASQSLMLIHNKVRRSLGSSGPLRAWVIDSFTGLAGTGVLLSHAVQLRDAGMPANDIATTLETFRRQVRTLLVPDDVRFLYRSLQVEGTQRVGAGLPRWKLWLARLFDLKPILVIDRGSGGMLLRMRGFDAACDRALSITSRHIALGLSTPTVCISVAGPLDFLRTLPAFTELAAVCKRQRIDMIVTPMSMTGCVKLGPRAISVAFASERFHG